MVITGDVTIVVEDDDNDPQRLDELIRQLHEELLLLDLPEVGREMTSAAVGTKSGILPSLTTLVVSGGFSVAALRSLTIVVAEWIKRCGARKAVLVVGEYRLEIEGASKKTQDAAVNAFIQAAAADGSATISPPVHSTLAHAPLEGSRGEV